MKAWPVKDAQARFGDLLDSCLADGPQLVTLHGEEAAVLVPAAAWRALNGRRGYATLKDWLLADEARGDIPLPPRGEITTRPPPEVD